MSYYAALSEALRFNSPLFFRPQQVGKWNYATADCAANGRQWECYFKGIGRSHTEFNLDQVSTRRLYSVFLPPVDAYYNTNNHQQPAYSFKTNIGARTTPIFHNWTDMLQPPAWAEALGDARWWEGQLADALWCLNSSLLAEIGQIKARLGWRADEDVIGIHIRRTDRLQLLDIPPSAYFEAALALQREQPHLRKVYLATDEPQSVLSEAKNYNTFEVMTVTSEDMNYGLYRTPGAPDIEVVTRMCLVDLELLASTKYFIGAQRSAYSWLASRLQLGRGNQRACPVFVDKPHSYAYGYWNGSGYSDCF